MKIAYLCHRIPYPPDKGDKIRAFHQLQGIATGHEVDLFTLIDDPLDTPHRHTLARYCREVTTAAIDPRMAYVRALPFLLRNKALTIPYFHSPELRKLFRRAVAKRSYDRIFVYCSAMAQYSECAAGVPIITDLVDVDSDKWRQYVIF